MLHVYSDIGKDPCMYVHTCISGPAVAIAAMVSEPMESTMFLNLSVSIPAISLDLDISSSFCSRMNLISASRAADSRSSSDSYTHCRCISLMSIARVCGVYMYMIVQCIVAFEERLKWKQTHVWIYMYYGTFGKSHMAIPLNKKHLVVLLRHSPNHQMVELLYINLK